MSDDDGCFSVRQAVLSWSSNCGEEFRLRLGERGSSVRALEDLQQPCEGHVVEFIQRGLLEVLLFRGLGRGQSERPWIVLPEARGFETPPRHLCEFRLPCDLCLPSRRLCG